MCRLFVDCIAEIVFALIPRSVDHLLARERRSLPRSSLETRDQGGVMEEAGEITTRDIGQHLPGGSETAA